MLKDLLNNWLFQEKRGKNRRIMEFRKVKSPRLGVYVVRLTKSVFLFLPIDKAILIIPQRRLFCFVWDYY